MTAREECTCVKLPGDGRLPMDDCPVHSSDVVEPSWQDVAERLDVERLEHIAEIERLRSSIVAWKHEEREVWEPMDAENAKLREWRDALRYEWDRYRQAHCGWGSLDHLIRGYDGVPRTVLVNAIAEIERLRAENAKLRDFFEAVFEDAWDLCVADGGDLQDTAERLGLIVKVPADEQFKDEYDSDEMFVWSWHPLALEGKCNS